MNHFKISRLFSLMLSFALLISPLPLSSMTEDFMNSLSIHDKNMIMEHSDESYIFLDKKLSTIVELISRMSELGNDTDLLVHQLKKHMDLGYAVAEYNVVLETLNQVKSFLHHKKKDAHENGAKGKRSPPYIAVIQGTLSVTDSIGVDSITATTASVTDAIIQGSIQLQDSAGGQYVGLQAPSVVPTSYTVTLPPSAPTSNQVLRAGSATPTDLGWVTTGGSVAPATSQTIYVAKYGNDITGNGSLDTPYASLTKAIETANSISSAVNPVAIVILSGIYTEDNSAGPLTITVAGVSIVGESASSVIIMPSTPANNLLLIEDTVHVADITLQSSSPLGTGISCTAGDLSVFNNLRVFNSLIGINCAGGASESYGFNTCFFVGCKYWV